MKQNAIYIIPPFPIFSRSIENNFEKFTDKDLTFLKATLYLNLLENVSLKKEKAEIFRIFDLKDKDLLSSELISHPDKPILCDVINLKSVFEELSQKEFGSYKNNLIIFSNSVDIRQSDIDKYFNLLSIDDNALILSKSTNGIIKVIGFNFFTDELFKQLVESHLQLDTFLSYNKSCEYFVNTLADVIAVSNMDDFKKLYIELSQKKSNEYCSQKMHERFTHLFVEYKELLK